MDLSKLDIAVLGGYLLVITLMGIYFARKMVDTEEYFVGGRSLPGWAIGLSLVGTSISSITFVAYPGDAFKTAWLRFVPNLMLPVGVGIAALYFLPFTRPRPPPKCCWAAARPREYCLILSVITSRPDSKDWSSRRCWPRQCPRWIRASTQSQRFGWSIYTVGI